MNIYHQVISSPNEIDEYEYFSTTIKQISNNNLDVLLKWETTLSNQEKILFTNISKMRRVQVINCNNNETVENTNESISMLNNLNLGTVPRRIISIKRNNNNNTSNSSNFNQ